MATVTASDQLAMPRASHVGPCVARATYTQNGATLSASDIVLGVKIPNGAWITDGYISGNGGSSALILRVGVQSGANTTLLSLGTLSATEQMVRFNGGSLPFKVSLSDDAALQYSYVYLTVNTIASPTATGSIQLLVRYAMPGAI